MEKKSESGGDWGDSDVRGYCVMPVYGRTL